MLPVREYRDDCFIFFATANGTVKRTSLDQFSRPRSVGLIAIDLDEGDRLVGAAITSGSDHAMLLSSNGKAIRFEETNVRAMGRTARGVRGMRLQDGAEVISLIIPQTTLIDSEADDDQQEPAAGDVNGNGNVNVNGNGNVNGEQVYILTASENGYGKRTRLEEFPLRGHGGQGVIAMQTSERNGSLVAAMQVATGDEMMLITDRGTLVRTRVEEVSITSRNTQGVMLIRLGESETLVKTVRVDEPDGDPSDDASPDGEVSDNETADASATGAGEGDSHPPGDADPAPDGDATGPDERE